MSPIVKYQVGGGGEGGMAIYPSILPTAPSIYDSTTNGNVPEDIDVGYYHKTIYVTLACD
jgi:hypothetical protein